MITLDFPKLKDWNIEALTGYAPKTTFYTDFSIADAFGRKAIIDTVVQAFNNWKDDIEYITELIMAVNWKQFEHYETNYNLFLLYQKIWMTLDNWAYENLNGDDLDYYLRTTD